ncbi:preprotein translocase subunit SecY [Butyrivibrio fibrisolvens]|uniref:preprotein translocase subunit SecY n=1 Tax=Pseudobutyrivibrio ruminis TaxID=46206 RepID=UPI000480D4B0|nr:preprotein translocase subunit SecY [Pseudobutyrivibrio ruminis]MDC7278626.1 preprotein translocase subunit SecY [Butyrivibrio fibrisolvens]
MKKHYFPKTLFQKLIFTFIIMAAYLVGRELPLYGVDLAAYDAFRDKSADLIMQTIGGDRYKTSLLALGISPFMFSTLFVQMIVAFKSADSKSHTSPKKITRATLILMVIWASVQAYLTTKSTIYIYDGGTELILAKVISGIEMVTGAFVILWLATRNGKYGVGGQTILIYVNILDSVVNTVKNIEFKELKVVGILSVIALVFTIIFENTEYRIPMQRISIHSIFSDKNYIPIKLNPIGMMPVMFASAFFQLPAYIITWLAESFQDNGDLQWLSENMDTNHPLGIGIYIVVLYVITIIFSFIFISPKNLAESLQKAGDSITGLKAGRKTRVYIRNRLLIIAIFSATFLSLFIALPLYLHMEGMIPAAGMSLPSILIAMASINCNLYREFRAVKEYDAYIPFI